MHLQAFLRKAAVILLIRAIVIGCPLAAMASTTGSVQGKIRESSGQPVQGAQIFLLPSGLIAKTDKRGYYAFVGILPGPYTLRVEADGFEAASDSLSIVQDITSAVDVTLVREQTSPIVPVKTGHSRITGSPTRRTETATEYTITARNEQLTRSQPNNLYQFPGLIFGYPGITYDPSDYVHIRGSDINQVGFQVDGIQITQPLNNTFATNLNTIALKSANLYTGGADSSYGNATGGYINEITNNGRDLQGGIFEGTLGPGYGWNYAGNYTQYGGVTKNGKVDYYASDLVFKNHFPNNTQTQSLDSSVDGVLKANYYADPDNTVTGFYSHGFENYGFYEQPPNPALQRFKYITSLGTSVDQGGYVQDHVDQGYDFSYVTLRHSFSPSSFFTYRLYRLFNFGTLNQANIAARYQELQADQVGNQLDYTKQMTARDRLRAGFEIIPARTHNRGITDRYSTNGTMEPFSTIPATGYEDRTSDVNANQTALYLSNELRTADDKATLTTGVRYGSMLFGLHNGGGKFSDMYLDPRIGATYSPTHKTTFRSNFAVQSEFPDTLYIEQLTPEELGLLPTATDAATQEAYIRSRYAEFNRLGTTHSNNFDLGVEQALSLPTTAGLLSGPYTVNLTAFQKYQYDLQQYNRTYFVSPTTGGFSGPRTYDNGGRGHATGVEMVISKPKHAAHDLNGFISYTNQVAKATNSDFDTGLVPYFGNAFLNMGGVLGLTDAQFRAQNAQQYSTSYDQRHTVAVVVNKQISNLLETTAILDAGSGFPFVNVVAQNHGTDGQHVNQSIGSAYYNEVPITLMDQQTLQPLNPIVGRTGWHYKISLNTTLHISETTSLFFNVDNLFDKKIVVGYGTATQAGTPYYLPPSPQYPQGRLYYGPSTVLSPLFLSFGIRQKF